IDVMNAAIAIRTNKSPYTTRSCLTMPHNCKLLGSWAYKNGVRKVFIMVADYAPGHDAETSFERGFKSAGGEIVGALRMPVANPDFSAFVQRAKDAAPDGIVIFVPGGSPPP